MFIYHICFGLQNERAGELGSPSAVGIGITVRAVFPHVILSIRERGQMELWDTAFNHTPLLFLFLSTSRHQMARQAVARSVLLGNMIFRLIIHDGRVVFAVFVVSHFPSSIFFCLVFPGSA